MMRTKCLLILLLQWTLAYSQSIDIEQAVKNKLIVVDASINSTPINGHYVAGFSGECIQLKVKNISNAYREIVLSAGQFLVPEDCAEAATTMLLEPCNFPAHIEE